MTLCILMLALAAPPEIATSTAEPRAYHVISAELRDAMKREALAESKPERAAAIRDMTAVYTEILHDPRLIAAPTLQQYKAKLYSRLLRVKKDLQREVGRANKAPRGAERTAEEEALAEQQSYEATQDLANQMAYISSTLGGPASVFAEAGSGGGAGVADDGEALIELIERTINPEFWDTNGGPGSMFYFRNLHALVITATDDVHRNLGGTLEALRRAGN